MPLAFVDMDGVKGFISDDLSVTHYGQNGVKTSIEARIDDVEADAETMEDALESLILELPHTCSIREISRINTERETTTRCGR